MNTFTTLEEIQAHQPSALFTDDKWELRPEQREAIDLAKDQFCKRSGVKGSYVWSVRSEYKQFLWNAKMRFGKTMCALQLAREMGMRRTLIVTHRPVVNQNWKEDFDNVFGDKILGNTNVRNHYAYGTLVDEEQHDKRRFYDLEKFVETEGNHYVFFVSMQYLRLSELVNAKTQAKNQTKQEGGDLWGHDASKENEKLKADILNTDWDLVVIDEAHEGTRTSLGKRVIDEFLHKKETKMLHLSGTPFNLYEDFDNNEIYTWDYIAEQSAKQRWYKEHPGEKNPYEELPRLNIATYDIRKTIDKYLEQDGLFTFNEFFRTWTGNPKADNPTGEKMNMPEGAKGRFVHEEDVLKFLDLLCTKDETNNFPFSTDEYRRAFRHTLWVVSHVDEAHALETLLNEHRVFKRFNIINVAGNNPEDETKDNALDKVLNAIGDLPEQTSTITISCGRLTTGVTVKPWSAVLYLKGGDSPATYMQTIFRVQSPYKTADGRMKTNCYVFDFAPDRAGMIVAGTAKFTSMAKSKEAKRKVDEQDDLTQEQKDKQTLQDFLAFCPMFSIEGAQMTPMDVNTIFKQLENVFIDRLVRKGFDDPCLYNQEELNKINPELINQIGENGGQAPDERRHDAKPQVDLSHMTPEQRAAWEENIRQKKAAAAEKAKRQAEKDEEFKKQWDSWTEEQKEEWLQKEAEKEALREKRKEEREEFKRRMTNIRGIALRIPLLMYGGADAGDPKEDLTVDNFTRKIKDESWEEFMPKGISKEDFNKIRKCFNATRFEEAGKKYRALTREADFMHVDERIQQIAEIFSYFRNPDKETVLTPWRVVNMHMSETIGGWCFFDESFDEKNGMLEHPRFVEHENVTSQLFDNVDLSGEVQTKILEINSKTGLYPLYVTYSLYRRRLQEYIKAECIDPATISVQEEQVVWDDIVAENIYVICNTPMAVGITRRTLFGFREIEKKANIKAEKLIERTINDQESLVSDLKSKGFWKGTRSNIMLEFNAVVGNPPYQMGINREPAYHYFIDLGRSLGKIGTTIHPARFLFNAGKTPATWNEKMLHDNHYKVVKYWSNPEEVFDNVDIKGGVAITMWNEFEDFGEIGFFVNHSELSIIKDKVVTGGFVSFADIVYPRDLYRLTDTLYEENAWAVNRPSRGHKYDLGTNAFDLFPELFSDYVDSPSNYALIIGRNNNGRISKYIKKEYVKLPDNFDSWKVFVAKANGSGMLGEELAAPFVAAPGSGSTTTFLSIGKFENEEEATACLKYIKTKFVRLLLGILKVTQDNPRDVWKYVPMQDFSSESEINWKNSIADIDEQLFVKYDIDLIEQEFIKNTVKPME